MQLTRVSNSAAQRPSGYYGHKYEQNSGQLHILFSFYKRPRCSFALYIFFNNFNEDNAMRGFNCTKYKYTQTIMDDLNYNLSFSFSKRPNKQSQSRSSHKTYIKNTHRMRQIAHILIQISKIFRGCMPPNPPRNFGCFAPSTNVLLLFLWRLFHLIPCTNNIQLND